ncbi:Lacal_2735 family protein [Tenacibaculum sp. M341]|uniref:Lacal_2735 family protein n=1 Tax=Tenacibaculum sp. M341 TaxID=2530339 RepID=UPI00104AAE8E|nr:Lacal_2735 family protein [Tenacibaculum sp. M341]TCI85557.1 Lacal_2735 family protein [Tenacibaculum sp. M341]
MSQLKQLIRYKRHLEDRYEKLMERSNDYKYVDEAKSDIASYKAMKILEKISRIKYLDNSLV